MLKPNQVQMNSVFSFINRVPAFRETLLRYYGRPFDNREIGECDLKVLHLLHPKYLVKSGNISQMTPVSTYSPCTGNSSRELVCRATDRFVSGTQRLNRLSCPFKYYIKNEKLCNTCTCSLIWTGTHE